MSVTSYKELYKTLCQVVTRSTGRPCWQRTGIQGQPSRTYATAYLTRGLGHVQDVVEILEKPIALASGETLTEKPRGATHLHCEVDFVRSTTNDSALDAGTRFKNSLFLNSRFDDLWSIAGLTGEVNLMDISAIFRADTEERCKVVFGMYANISVPDLLADDSIFEIDSQAIDIYVDDPQDEHIHLDIHRGD